MKTIVNNRIIQLVTLGIIFFLGFLVRTWHLSYPIADWHSWRQVDTASVTRIYVDEKVDLLHPKYYDLSRIQTGMLNLEGYRMVEFPIYNFIHANLEKNFPLKTIPHLAFDKSLLKQKKIPASLEMISSDSLTVWGRLTTIGFSLIAALFMYLLAKEMLGNWGGILSAFYFLFLPFNIYYSRTILPEMVGVCFLVSALYFFVVFIRKNNNFSLITSAILFALATLIKPFLFVYIVPLIYLTFKKFGFKQTLTKTKLYIFAAISIIPFFAWRMWVANYLEGIPHFDWAFNSDKIRFRPSFWYWIFGERVGRLILGIWGLVVFGVGLVSTAKDKFFGFTFFIGSILYVTIVATASVRHDYYQILIIPSICYLLALGTVELWNSKLGSRLVARGFTVFSICMMLLLGWYVIRDYYQINHPEIIEAGKAVEKLTPKDAWVIAPYNGDTAFLYQTHRYGWPVVDEPIEKMVEKGADYYVSVNYDNDTNYVLAKYEVVEKTNSYVIVDLTKEK